MGREEFADLSDLGGRQASQHIGEIVLRVQAAPPATGQDGVDHRATPSGLGMADEQPPLAVMEVLSSVRCYARLLKLGSAEPRFLLSRTPFLTPTCLP